MQRIADYWETAYLYITGSSNFPNVLQILSPLIIQGVQANIKPGPTPVFLTTNSCTAVKDMFSANSADRMIHDPAVGSALAKYAQYFDQNGNMIPCLLGPAGQTLDIGESDVYSTTCDPTLMTTNNSTIIEAQGPVQAMVFAVPASSNQYAISQEAARQVFGIGGNGGVAQPWTMPNLYFVRNKNTGTQQMIGLEIGVQAGEFWGVDQGSADNVKTRLEASNGTPSERDSAIGILAVDLYDSDRDNLRALAYRTSGQDCAYLPDSTQTSKDKQNVRDGHYPIWGPLHFFTRRSHSRATSLAR